MPAPRTSRVFQELLQRLSDEHNRQIAELHAENDRLKGFGQPLQAYPSLPDPQNGAWGETLCVACHRAVPSEVSSHRENTVISTLSVKLDPDGTVLQTPDSTYLPAHQLSRSQGKPDCVPALPIEALVVHDHYLGQGASNGLYTNLRNVTLASPRGVPDMAALNAAYAVATIAEEVEEDAEFLDTDLADLNEFDKPLQLPRDAEQVINMRPLERPSSPAIAPPLQAPGALRAEARKVENTSTLDVPSTSFIRKGGNSLTEDVGFSIDPRQFSHKSPLERWQALIKYAQEQNSPFKEQKCVLAPAWEEAEDVALTVQAARGHLPAGGIGSLGSSPEGVKRYSKDLDMMFKGTASHARSTRGHRSKIASLVETSTSTTTCACHRPKLVLMHPNSRKRVFWDVICMLLLAHDLILIPMQVFEKGTAGMPAGYDKFMRIFDVVSACFWTGDMAMSLFTGYFSSEGFLELRFKAVMWNYLKSWFPLDFLIVGADWITLAIGMGSTSGYLRLGKTVSRVMRVFRLLRFMKLNTSMKAILQRINSEYVLTLAGLVRLVIYIVITSHYIACGWYALSQAGNRKRNWAHKFLNHTDSMAYAYSTALHWSLTQFTPASMEVVPQSAIERLFNCFVIIIAMVTFSSFVSSITSAMTHIRNINARKMEQDAKIRQYFSENKVSHQLASRIWFFLRKNRIQNAKFLREEDLPILKALPERIRDELRLEVYLPLLVNHPVFAIYFNLDPKPMRAICKHALSHRTLSTHEELFSEEAMGNGSVKSMFFVQSGGIYYNLSQDHALNISLTRGHWACEVALWGARACLEGPFVASAGGCDILMISGVDFQEITKQHLESLGFLVKYAQLFIENFNQALQDPECDNILFDKIEVLHWMAVQAYESVGYAIRHQGSTVGRDNIIRALFDVPYSRLSSTTRVSTSSAQTSSFSSDQTGRDIRDLRASEMSEMLRMSSNTGR